MEKPHVVTLNSGSSSIKFAVYELHSDLPKLLHGAVENIREAPVLKLFAKDNHLVREAHFKKNNAYNFFYELLFSALKTNQFGFNITTVGHRVVHGGNEFVKPILITPEITEN
ncbi:Propionate kinase [Legionella parisiensis]|uniref:Propionate kinase n=1 Tax=Legionella parisiensis TaxID=45071 RepID=A0A1E5JND9_9GAMM|nr:Propionate kinase [Legionella parisiensis]